MAAITDNFNDPVPSLEWTEFTGEVTLDSSKARREKRRWFITMEDVHAATKHAGTTIKPGDLVRVEAHGDGFVKISVNNIETIEFLLTPISSPLGQPGIILTDDSFVSWTEFT